MKHYTYQNACISHLDCQKRYRRKGSYGIHGNTVNPVEPSPMGGYRIPKIERGKIDDDSTILFRLEGTKRHSEGIRRETRESLRENRNQVPWNLWTGPRQMELCSCYRGRKYARVYEAIPKSWRNARKHASLHREVLQ